METQDKISNNGNCERPTAAGDNGRPKAAGPCLVHNKLLVKAINIISGPLASLFTRSLEEIKFPKIWKIAFVTPVNKPGKIKSSPES